MRATTTARRWRGIAAGAVLALTIGVGGAATASTPPPWECTAPAPASSVIHSGGVLRFDAGFRDVRVHKNQSHAARGILSAKVNWHGNIVVEQSVTGAHRWVVMSAIVQADETLVTRGISGGISGGTGTSEIRLYDSKLGRQLDLNVRSDWDRLAGPVSNLWLQWTHLDAVKDAASGCQS